jgi:CRP/FNR family transcriptional regulator, cyclic AMP receptor protein
VDSAASIRRFEAFSHFSEEDATQLAGCVHRRRFPSGTAVLQQGEQSFDAYLITRGRVKIQRQTAYGLYPLAVLETGELFGEASFIDQQGRSGEAVADGDTELLVLNPKALAAACAEDHHFTVALYWTFWRSLSRKLRRANEHLVRFFSEASTAPEITRPAPRPPTGEFQVGLAAKRRLFEEQTLSQMEITFLSTLSKEKKLAAGEVIFHEGEAGDRMYVVLDGQVMISKFIPGAGEEALAFLERGDYFGEMALIDNQPRSADAKAHTGGAVVLAIPREVVEGILDIRKVSSLRLLKILCSLVAKRLREIDDKIAGWFILSGGGRGLTHEG